MCGIAGILTHDSRTPDERALLSMANCMAHRGPDGEGVLTAPGIGLAHRRLAILDLTSRASQPMTDESGKLVIVFNGEIYNYRELRDELAANWRTESDTEVILEGYRAWGTEIVKRLRGMFAFALWDGGTRRLLLVRDHIGKKPLFFANASNGDLVFASEIKAMRGMVALTPDLNDLRTFLGLQYIPSPHTGFEGVRQLEPGCTAICEAGCVALNRYHRYALPDDATSGAAQPSNAEVDEGIRARLEKAVKIRQLTADVPVGAFLSGGIDSAAVVAFATKYLDVPLQTFTMGFPELHLDERQEARLIARQFGTDHQEFEARPEHLMELIDKLVQHYDVPYADSSALPLWLLSKETAQEIKVVLTGDGGDEVFGGYRRYTAYQQALKLSRVPLLSGVLSPISRALGPILHDPRFPRMAEVVWALHQRSPDAYGELFCGAYFPSRSLLEICTPEFLAATAEADAVKFISRFMNGRSDLPQAMLFDLVSYLPDDLNVKMDRATMAFGLEARAPFLDQDLVTWTLTLPLQQKLSHGKTKVALKRALKGIVPDAVLNRPKRGFQVPLSSWFRGSLAGLVAERILSQGSPLHRFIQRAALERLVADNARGSDHGNRLWMLLTLATWLEQNL